MESKGGPADVAREQALGKRVKSAGSSLDSFALELDDGTALLAKAINAGGRPAITTEIVQAQNLTKLSDAVCKVDWSWIYGSTVISLSYSQERLKLELDPAGPLAISVAVWQGSPFLAFQPFRPARA